MGNRIEKSLIVDLHNNNIKRWAWGMGKENNLNSSQHTTWTYGIFLNNNRIVCEIFFS